MKARFTPPEQARMRKLYSQVPESWSKRDRAFMDSLQRRINAEAEKVRQHADLILKHGKACHCCGEEERMLLDVADGKVVCKNCNVSGGCPAAVSHGWIKSYRLQMQTILESARSAPLPIPSQVSITGPVLDPQSKKVKIGKIFRVEGALDKRFKVVCKLFKNKNYRHKIYDDTVRLACGVVFWAQDREGRISKKKAVRFRYEELSRILGSKCIREMSKPNNTRSIVDMLEDRLAAC